MHQNQSRNIIKNTSITFRLPNTIKEDIYDVADKEMLKVSDIARKGVIQYVRYLQKKYDEKRPDGWSV
tara:strand:+ start:278 stop:481 length:204 start_codon:yes stop_codon:yes gene_type:complete